ncbi:hypothetical protein HN803_06130 [candidate division WWE3 bacterium]|jgi:hypothetical protein|nr:hypothetical protein [candidate division WWE3 bacterium]MBT7350333.1 hypothetical protein [candidate division WWE3 bacterium]
MLYIDISRNLEKLMNETPKLKGNKALPVIIVVVVLGAAFFVFKGFYSTKFAERQAEKMFEAQTGGKADIDFDGGSKFEMETEEGKIIIDQQGSLPGDFPEDIEIYPNADVTAYVSMDSADVKGFNATLTTKDSGKEVYPFYLDSLTDNGWNIISKLDTEAYQSLGAEKDSRTMVITITNDGEDTIAVITVKTD